MSTKMYNCSKNLELFQKFIK